MAGMAFRLAGWTLDSFDFTIFLLVMLPISREFGVPFTGVAVVFSVTLWMRLLGAVSSGWLGDPVVFATSSPASRRLSDSSCVPRVARHRHRRGMARRRGLGDGEMGRSVRAGLLQGSWGIGFLLSSAACGS